ncbi:COP9 signalosome complex subunit 1-like [Bolinopsis microptera]|uniref:COP9 signalosome complex subunit 1-like n=1 Tax=Bolinopsis microptera TaxID=2820187 RepID=UPI00307AA8CD
MEPMDVEASPVCLDLDSYISQYVGNVCLQRLKFYVDNSRPSSDNYRLLIQTAMDCKNITVYTDAVEALNNTCPSEGISVNVDWITQTSKYLINKVDRLEQDLKSYQLSQDKENIRRTHQMLGDHYHDCGDLSNAIKHYQKSRDYGTTVAHTMEFLLNIIKVSVYLNHWTSVSNYIKKTDHIDNTDVKITRRLLLAKGLCEMSHNNYKNAARIFSNIPCDTWDNETISPLCVLVYASLCALASFNRKDFQKLLIENNNFKQYMDAQPTIRNFMFAFYNREYSVGLRALELLRSEFKLDLFLSPHVDNLFEKIRSESIKQYYSPYLTCDMNKMAEAFNTTIEDLELELMKLVADQPVRIDSHNKVLRASEDDEGSRIFENVLDLSLTYKQKTQALLVKSAILKAGLVIKAAVEEKPSTST